MSDSPSDASPDRCPVLLVTGQTGAGKSHFIRELIRDVNSVDAEAGGTAPKREVILIRHRHAKSCMLETFPPPYSSSESSEKAVSRGDGYRVCHFSEVFDFGSGCVCCAPDGDLMNQLVDLSRNQLSGDGAPGRHLLVLETTGLADCAPFLRIFQQEDLIKKDYELWGVVCVVDSRRWEYTLLKEEQVEKSGELGAKSESSFVGSGSGAAGSATGLAASSSSDKIGDNDSSTMVSGGPGGSFEKRRSISPGSGAAGSTASATISAGAKTWITGLSGGLLSGLQGPYFLPVGLFQPSALRMNLVNSRADTWSAGMAMDSASRRSCPSRSSPHSWITLAS